MNRGDVYMANLGEAEGHEQAGVRPVVILQGSPLNSVLSTVVIVPFTGQLGRAKTPTCQLIPKGDGGLASDSLALCHMVRALDKAKLKRRMGTLSDASLEAIEGKLRYSLDL